MDHENDDIRIYPRHASNAGREVNCYDQQTLSFGQLLDPLAVCQISYTICELLLYNSSTRLKMRFPGAVLMEVTSEVTVNRGQGRRLVIHACGSLVLSLLEHSLYAGYTAVTR